MAKKFINLVIAFILVALLQSIFFPQPAEASPDWWDIDWQCRMKLTFDNTAASENLNDFPVLVHLTSAHSDFWAHINDSITTGDTKDLRFIDGDDATELYFEAERINYVSNDAEVWVTVPQIDAGSNTDFIYVYYGNPAASQSVYHSASDVWDANFKMVLHLNETSGTNYDSTINNNDASVTGTPVQNATGRIAGGIEFEGVANEWIANSSPLDTSDGFTIELWGDYQIRNGYQTDIWYQSSGAGWRELITIDSSGNIRSWWNGGSFGVDLGTDWDYDEWHHYVFAYDGDTVYVYKDGQFSSQVTTNYNSSVGVDHWKIGDRDDTNQPVDGTVDEYRFSTTDRSSDWIEAQYLSMTDAFVTYGVEEEPPDAPSNLGPASYVDGSWGADNTPTVNFTQSDPDVGDTVRYTIQIDDSADFGSAVVDYTSGLLPQGATSFTVGQAVATGVYNVGFEAQVLVDGSYYWRVMSADDSGAWSDWSLANGGAVAFRLETTSQIGGPTTSTGAAKDKFATGDNVYATGGGFFPGSNLDVYVVADRQWSNRDLVPADVGDGMDTIPTDGSGNFGPVVIWSAPLQIREYDLVFDANQDGFYDAAIDLVDEPNHPGFSVLPPPKAGFTAAPTSGICPLTVDFTDTSSGDITSWLWDFGDGSISNEQNPSHTYTSGMTCTVALTVTGPGGTDTETKANCIKVSEPSSVGGHRPAKFFGNYLNISPIRAYPNQTVTISLNVANIGGTRGNYDISLNINGRTEESQVVSLDPGSSQRVTFRVTKSSPGTYNVNVAEMQGQFSVVRFVTASPPATPSDSQAVDRGSRIVDTTADSGGLDTTGIIAITVIGLVVIIGIIIAIRQAHPV